MTLLIIPQKQEAGIFLLITFLKSASPTASSNSHLRIILPKNKKKSILVKKWQTKAQTL